MAMGGRAASGAIQVVDSTDTLADAKVRRDHH